MSIQLITSNSLTGLAEQLTDGVMQNDAVFRPAYIVTQTEGMNNWLKLQIAERLGISANIQFLKPNDAVHLVFQLLGGKYTQAISAHDLTWLLFEILNDSAFKSQFPKVADYYEAQPGSEIKRISLASKVADLFDQYQIYRADIVEMWDEGKAFFNSRNSTSETRETEAWQKELWTRAKTLAKNDFPNKNYIGKYILKTLKEPGKPETLREKMPAIYFFGLSVITEYHLRIFTALSQYIGVHFLIQNPAPAQYWYDDKTEKVIDFLKNKGILPPEETSHANPLLVGWGQLTKDIFTMLFQNEDTLNTFNEVNLREPPNDSLLHTVQSSIFNNQKDDLHITEKQINDGTITINACFSPRREVEVLYDYLVYLIDQKKEALSARDIAVMVPDIDAYASYIRAVFDNAPYPFHYSVSDKTAAEDDSIANSLIEILSLKSQQFTSEKVVGLLSFSAIRKNFQITDINMIRRLVDKANIRFGISGNFDDDSRYVSWEYGLSRIMYGLCMTGDDVYGNGKEGFYPLDEVEGSDIGEVTRFTYFVSQLMQHLNGRQNRRSIADWVRYTEETMLTFLGDSDSEDEDYLALINQLERYNVIEEIFPGKVSYEVFIHDFLPSIEQIERSKVFISGGITFCSLIPMRSIPFRVVALMGMNFDKFPRAERHIGFDLMQVKKRHGDRNLRENDKHLFLETLLSAQDYLYISYIGQNIKDNSPMPPSVLVDELIDFICSQTDRPEETRKRFVQKHPLHNFSSQYNSGNPRLYSYLLENKAQWPDLSDMEPAPAISGEITIDEFISFLKNPLKGFYNRVLHVFYREDETALRETELFFLDRRQEWKIKNELMGTDEINLHPFIDEGIKKGFLPLRNMADVSVSQANESITGIRSAYQNLRKDFEEETLDIDLQMGSWRLTGKIGGIFNNFLLRLCFAKSEHKYRLSAYLEYLILAASGKQVTVCFVSSGGEVSTGLVINQTEATSRLSSLIQLFIEGHQRIVVTPENFSPSQKKFDRSKFDNAVKNYFTGQYAYPDAYSKKEFDNGLFYSDETFNQFVNDAGLVIFPVESFFKENE